MARMRAVVLSGPGDLSALQLKELIVPEPEPGQVLIAVKAFGVNRAEVHTRRGLADGVTFPRVPGIEAAGVVAVCPGGEFTPGQQVVATAGGMGRTLDGGYAEYTCVPVAQVVPFTSDLDWPTLGAVPAMLRTAHGALSDGLAVQAGQTLLIRDGSSPVGLAAAVLAAARGLTVVATTRTGAQIARLRAVGADHVLIDDGEIARQVHDTLGDGVDAALDLVGAPTLPDTLRATRRGGVVCAAGTPADASTTPDLPPTDDRRGVRLTAYGDAAGLPADVLQGFLDDVAAGRASVALGQVFPIERIRDAHSVLEGDRATGKVVVLPRPLRWRPRR